MKIKLTLIDVLLTVAPTISMERAAEALLRITRLNDVDEMRRTAVWALEDPLLQLVRDGSNLEPVTVMRYDVRYRLCNGQRPEELTISEATRRIVVARVLGLDEVDAIVDEDRSSPPLDHKAVLKRHVGFFAACDGMTYTRCMSKWADVTCPDCLRKKRT